LVGFEVIIEAMTEEHDLFTLIAPRPTFTKDTTDEERRLMDEHGRYFSRTLCGGKVLLFGHVMATHRAFGFAVLEVDNEAEVKAGRAYAGEA
jgi:hypothetical protein